MENEDIAIIGMAGIYPGAPTVTALWRNILSKVEAISDAPLSWNSDFFHDSNADADMNDRTYCRRGGYIDQFARFAPAEFGIMPGSVDGSDPEQFLALRAARDALADAGYLDRPFDREHAAVIIGHGNYQHRGFTTTIGHVLIVPLIMKMLKDVLPDLPDSLLCDIRQRMKASLPPFTPDTTPGQVSNVIAGRIANRLDLMGPNYLVDAACASSLVAVASGIQELRSGKCGMVIAGGAQVNNNAIISIMFSMLGALSRSGHLRPFDKKADGTLLGEGIGMAVLRRLSDAERDGDRIYAVIKSVGISSDGRAQTLFVPRLEGEIAAMRRAYEDAKVDPVTIGLVEAHGTGTPVGDRTESQAMAAVFGPKRGAVRTCAVGSVKSMISHTIPASGMAGLFKAALALHQKVLPPTLCDEPNPELGLETSALYINSTTRPWIHGGKEPRRAGVSAFGFGGINTHAVLEEYQGNATCSVQGVADGMEWGSELFIITGGSRSALLQRVITLQTLVEKNLDLELCDVAFTLHEEGGGLTNGDWKIGLVARSMPDLNAKLQSVIVSLQDSACRRIHDRTGIYYDERSREEKGRLAILLPGEGAQYSGMLSDLCLHFPEVRQWFDQVDRVCLERGRELVPSQILYPPAHLTSEEKGVLDSALWDMAYAVPLVLAADSAILHLLLLLGIVPDAIAGHSTAQDLALEAASFLSDLKEKGPAWRPVLADRMDIRVSGEDVPKAQLLMVGACGYQEVLAQVDASEGKLFIAMDNCPNQVVLCGDEKAMERAWMNLTDRGAICQYLPFDRGYHTPLYRGVCEQLEQYAPMEYYRELRPQISAYSTTSGMLFPDDAEGKKRLLINQWSEPVRFRQTIETMYGDGIRIFVEAGARGNLAGFVDDILVDREHVSIPADVMNRSGILQLNHMLAILAAQGIPLAPGLLYARRECRRVSLDAAGVAQPATGKMSGSGVPLHYAVPLPVLDEESKRKIREFLSVSSSAEIETADSGGEAFADKSGDAVLSGHFRMMKEFLTTHEEVMSAFMKTGYGETGGSRTPELMEGLSQAVSGCLLEKKEQAL